LYHVSDLFELNVKLRCQKVNQRGLFLEQGHANSGRQDNVAANFAWW